MDLRDLAILVMSLALLLSVVFRVLERRRWRQRRAYFGGIVSEFGGSPDGYRPSTSTPNRKPPRGGSGTASVE